MKCGLVGLGRISEKHKECLLNLKDEINLVVACDKNPQKTKKFVDDFFTKGNRKPESVLDYKKLVNYNLDFVVIAVDTGNHFEIAKFFVENGIACMVEKPLALSGKQCKYLERVAKEKNLKCGVFFQNRFNLAVQYLKRAILEGRFGKISNISARMSWARNKEYYDQDNWRGKWISDGGAFSNQAVHCIDIVQWLANSEVASISSTISNILHPYIEVEDYGNMSIMFKNGIIANIEATVNCIENYEESILIIGENGYAKIGGVCLNKVLEWKFLDSKEYDKDVFASTNINEDFSQKTAEQEYQAKVYGNGHFEVYKEYIKDKAYGIDFKEASKAVNIILTAYLSAKLKKRIPYKTNINIKTMKGFKIKGVN